MDQFITIKQASVLTGKSEITIRRLIKRLSNQNSAESTQMIRREKTSAGYQYKVDHALLLKELKMEYLLSNQPTNQMSNQADHPTTQMSNHVSNQDELKKKKAAKTSTKEPDQTTTHAKKERDNGTIEILKQTIGILRDQLKVKDDQLRHEHEEKQELIRGNREAVATINLLSKQLLLAEANPTPEPAPESAPAETTTEEVPKKKRSFLNFFK
jgi:hypothetical protein